MFKIEMRYCKCGHLQLASEGVWSVWRFKLSRLQIRASDLDLRPAEAILILRPNVFTF